MYALMRLGRAEALHSSDLRTMEAAEQEAAGGHSHPLHISSIPPVKLKKKNW
jgi:hypothetical protein